MGRKAKIGLDSFTVSVDMMSDESMIKLDRKFGCKGVCVAMAILCEVYRNGYYLEWNDSTRISISSKFKEVTPLAVTRIVEEMVKLNLLSNLTWKMGAISSAKIQRKYFSLTSRRVLLNSTDNQQFPYILDEVKSEISVCRNSDLCKQKSHISVDKNSDLCKHKGNLFSYTLLEDNNNINNLESNKALKEEIKEENFGLINVHSIDALKTIMLASPIWKNDIRMYISRLTGRILSDQQIDDYIDTFAMKLKSEGETEKTEDDAKRHFTNWLRIELTKPSKSKPRFGREKVEDKVFEPF